jgi:photosystem II stability/assembly factor-like uncharacterized protein
LLAVLCPGCTWYSNCPETCTERSTECPDECVRPGAGVGAGGDGSSENGGGGSEDDAGRPGSDSGGSESGGSSGDAPVGGDPEGEWTEVTSNLAGLETECGAIQSVFSKPSADMLIAGVARRGLWVSVDGGDSWQVLGTAPNSAEILNRPTEVVFDPDQDDVFWESGMYSGPAVFRTDDNGASFVALGDVIHFDSLAVDFTDPGRQTLLGEMHEDSSVFLSTNGGQSWTEISQSMPGNAGEYCFNPMILDADTFILGCNGSTDTSPGILRSDDGGSSWSLVMHEPMTAAGLQTSDGTLYWVGEAGNLFRSEDGEDWREVTPPYTLNTAVYPIELPGGALAAVNELNIVVSTDEGATWRRASAAMPYRPTGIAYSAFQEAFFIWRSDCSAEVAADALQRFDY